MPVANVAALLVDARCRLGEGIVWCEQRQCLWWTDIQQSRLWQYHPQSGCSRHWAMPDRLGSLALCSSGGLLLGLAKGLHYLSPEALDADPLPAPELLAAVEPAQPQLRLNDGRCDRDGNFVFGTLNEDPARQQLGTFYQYSRRHGLRRLALGGVAIPNSLCFDPDGKHLYYCDSLQGTILRVAYDADSATVGEPQLFAQVAADASPDGAAIDADGRLWSARWGAGEVVCHDRDGSVQHVVKVPVQQPTCVCFGGPELDTLYITSAWDELDDAALAQQPQAGGVFALRLDGVRGLAESRFAA